MIGLCLEMIQSNTLAKNPLLGIYLEPEMDVGLEITAKIMKVNDKVVHCST